MEPKFGLKCGKCGESLTFNLSGGAVCSVYDRLLKCPYCSFENKVLPHWYRTPGYEEFEQGGLPPELRY
jgi:hypothetical protein